MTLQLMYEAQPAAFEQQVNESTGLKKYKIKGVFSSPGKVNRNGRIYPTNLWETEVQKYQDVIAQGLPNSLMELNHPARSSVDMMEAVAKIDKLYFENGSVMGEAVLLDNPKANQLKTLIDNGVKMSVSSRGVGSVKNGLVESYKLITFDIIPNLGASDFKAEMYGVVEGVLQGKEFMINESGEIEDFKAPKIKDIVEGFSLDEFGNIIEGTSSAVNEGDASLFQKEDIHKAFKEKFSQVLDGLK